MQVSLEKPDVRSCVGSNSFQLRVDCSNQDLDKAISYVSSHAHDYTTSNSQIDLTQYQDEPISFLNPNRAFQQQFDESVQILENSQQQSDSSLLDVWDQQLGSQQQPLLDQQQPLLGQQQPQSPPHELDISWDFLTTPQTPECDKIQRLLQMPKYKKVQHAGELACQLAVVKFGVGVLERSGLGAGTASNLGQLLPLDDDKLAEIQALIKTQFNLNKFGDVWKDQNCPNKIGNKCRRIRQQMQKKN